MAIITQGNSIEKHQLQKKKKKSHKTIRTNAKVCVHACISCSSSQILIFSTVITTMQNVKFSLNFNSKRK